jgi:hypothetical protein
VVLTWYTLFTATFDTTYTTLLSFPFYFLHSSYNFKVLYQQHFSFNTSSHCWNLPLSCPSTSPLKRGYSAPVFYVGLALALLLFQLTTRSSTPFLSVRSCCTASAGQQSLLRNIHVPFSSIFTSFSIFSTSFSFKNGFFLLFTLLASIYLRTSLLLF